mmetsp:Transcript_17624/g.68420  ORF Transcript_17624/g.68420 Transcript_17624/m.68420 type:complete len:327 (-) Transcript_17624:37-1017(-)
MVGVAVNDGRERKRGDEWSGYEVGMKLLCGGVAGSIAKTSIAPLERVKILFQVRNHHYQYTGVAGTLRSIKAQEGLKGLYKGNASSIARVFPYAAVQFVTFDAYKALFTPKDQSISQLGNFCAGAMCGATAVLCTYPLDVTRARLAVQVSKRQYTGLLHALQHMWRVEGGARALYRGLGPTMLGIVPYAGINFFCFDTLKWHYIHTYKHGRLGEKEMTAADIPTLVTLAFGGIAGITGQTITYPLDVVRRRMQIEGLQLEKAYSYRYKGTWHALRTIVQTEGWRMLFRGLHINYLKVVPMVSISFTMNDTLRRYFNLHTGGGVARH